MPLSLRKITKILQHNEPRVLCRGLYREFVSALTQEVCQLGRGDHASAVVDAVTNQRKCAINCEEKIAIRVRLGESEVRLILYKGRLDIVVTEERGTQTRKRELSGVLSVQYLLGGVPVVDQAEQNVE